MDFDNIHCDVGDLSDANVSADETHVDAAAAALPAVLSGLQLHEDLQEDVNDIFILQYVHHETNMFLFREHLFTLLFILKTFIMQERLCEDDSETLQD